MNLLKRVQKSGEDFEWYPTTNEILNKLFSNLHANLDKNRYRFDRGFSFLDIGCGDGKVFSYLENKFSRTDYRIAKKYGIEKSTVLIESLNKEVFIIGTDFREQTLIDKKIDVIFSNPPYSEYEIWATKIIREANCRFIYLVLPVRWVSSLVIQGSIKIRGASHKIIGIFDFVNAEDRTARAKVNLIAISLEREKSSFDIWFDTNFDIKAILDDLSDHGKEQQKRNEIKELTSKNNLIADLGRLYQKDLANLMHNYKLLTEVDPSLFNELKISLGNVKEKLRLKISGLKNIYWKELFDNLEAITNRLTHKSRNQLLDTLMDNTFVDFTISNAYSIIIWAIKNANDYFDVQLKDLYMQLSAKDNIRLYKSNNRLIEDGWRYSRSDMTHYFLDYRIVHHFYKSIELGGHGEEKGLYRDAELFIQDIFTIAKNLNFDVITTINGDDWRSGENNIFYYSHNSKKEIFAEIRVFKNGNMHFKFVPEFMKKLNVEAARLNGWIKSPKEAVKEMNVTIAEANEMYNCSIFLKKNNLLLLSEQ